ncbi:flagellar biosynthesis protein FlhF [Rubrivivax gelatinosus]|uniref:Flagellar biosynthesis protein FlhF n=2 Tax=Rubrivivax gelatinosus TaxID=28068 RepID=I0HPW6_RUBGI|nr:flagellar biosynthesis protein FlhF [Rubrivivax gelatinosus]MBG6081645.1 flagellar biosynthesis protein FlhF [Rubrivivax gelatinosus]BAL95053.1 GTP-binding signal recognition particle SRP54 G-domain FlhF [Rubrivivax gelatinosus IL144]
MNVKRFTARTSREALALVRQAFGEDAVVMSTRPCADGVEVLAMAPESLQQLERVSAAPAAPRARAAAPRAAAPRVEPRVEPAFDAAEVDEDVEQLEMSTLSFQDYVRERMLKRRQTELAREAAAEPRQPGAVSARRAEAQREEPPVRAAAPAAEPRARAAAPAAAAPAPRAAEPRREPPVLREEIRHAEPLLPQAPVLADGAPRRDQAEMMEELRSMRGLIEQRFGALAFMEKLQRQPRQAQLTQKLLGCGFSPSLVRKLVEGLPGGCDELAWAAGVLERNLATGERESPLEDIGGVFAMVGPTGVGKTTSTAKLAAAFATRHGAANLGLITLDAYRVGAHEQLRTYGRILGVPVHTAHDRASLEDLLDLLSAKKMVLIDTAGMAQRDARTRELLDMLSHRSINKLLVVNAAAQGETIEEVLLAYGAAACRGIVLSKMDEAVKLAPALDALIRYKLKVLAVANGQRVPEDWHRLSANALVQRALRGGGSPAWRMDSADMNLVFAAVPTPTPAPGHPLHA